MRSGAAWVLEGRFMRFGWGLPALAVVLALAGCVNREPEERAAFIAYLEQVAAPQAASWPRRPTRPRARPWATTRRSTSRWKRRTPPCAKRWRRSRRRCRRCGCIRSTRSSHARTAGTGWPSAWRPRAPGSNRRAPPPTPRAPGWSSLPTCATPTRAPMNTASRRRHRPWRGYPACSNPPWRMRGAWPGSLRAIAIRSIPMVR